MGSSLRDRLLSAAVFLPPLAALIWLGPWTFAALLAAVAVLGGWELSTLLGRLGWSAPRFLPVAAVVFLAGSLLGWFERALIPMAAVAWGLPLVWLFAPLVPREPRNGLDAWLVHLLGALYLGILLAYLGRLEAGPWREAAPRAEGAGWVFYAMAVILLSDTGAYAVGSRWGRHRLWPSVSPKKTWEGMVGGVLTSVGVAALLAGVLVPRLSIAEGALLGSMAGVAAPLGDLIESRVKRKAGVKDAGSIFPGHGGMLDRLDSVVFSAPVFYYGLIGLTR